ncbi:NHS-like protein 3 isoform X2 [Clinocottus analis]|uniref:NHS-like protein 3 isoform X2 n=1 Tax=Clinocottus analis TaxID=304258 RepID=UPI0035C1476C
MGNSVQKKKKKVQEGKCSSPIKEKPKGFWLFGHADKVKTAGPKGNEEQKRLTVHYRNSQHYQENVFIEGSRPQYLEDLHTEAQEGLKILQQEEHTNGVNLPDDESVASTDTLRPEQDISSMDGGGSPASRSTAGSTDTTVTSAASTRPALTRQGSTFKPLNPVKRLDKSRKRSRRTTIMGIPNQVQKELALHRGSTFQKLVSPPDHEGKPSDGQSGVVIVPTVDGGTPVANNEGARVHLSELEASREEQLLRKHLQAMYQDEQPFNHQGFGSYLGPATTMRPKSLAVPGMISSSSVCPSTMFRLLQEPQGPVMSISPQATYLSTIIPNAVLPASIEVIEIDRSSSRTRGGSVNQGRTVSRSSLASGDLSVSPLLSRRSDGDGDGDGYQTDNSHDGCPLMPSSASGLNWSETQSSKTVISNSSPASSKGSTRSGNSRKVSLNEREVHTEKSSGDQDLISLRSSVSSFSRETVVTVQGSKTVSGSVAAGEDDKAKLNFTRNMSVLKTKQPPPPPRRTNSLHSNKIRSNPMVLVDLNDSGSESIAAKDEVKSVIADTLKLSALVSNSTGSGCPNASSTPLSATRASSTEAGGATEPEYGSSSPQKTPSEEGKFERTMSPSSGYSSQSGTPTLSPKGISATSPDKQKKKPVKPERAVSRASSSAASPSSSLTSLSSGTSEPVHPDASQCSAALPPQGSPTTAAATDFPPENHRTTLGAEVRELLNIPPPPKVKAPCPPPPETWAHNKRSFQLLCGPCPNVSNARTQDGTVKQAGTQTEAVREMPVSEEKPSSVDKSVVELSEKPIETGPEGVHREVENRECSSTEEERMEASADVQKQEREGSPAWKDPKSPKKDPPPVMKKPVTALNKEASLDRQREKTSTSDTADVQDHATSSQHGVTILVVESDDVTEKSEVTSMQTLSVEVPKISKASPPPTPPPAYHPTPPPARKTPPSSVSTPPDELQRVQEESPAVECCWPPPPPPMEGDSVFDGGDEVDFPPPPPPLLTDSVTNVMDSCVTELDASKRPTEAVGGSTEHLVLGLSPDLPPAVAQTVTDTQPQVVVQISKAKTADEVLRRPISNCVSVSDSVPSPPVVASPLPPIARAESPVSAPAVVPSCSFLLPPVSGQPPIAVPEAPTLPADNFTHGINFRRQPSVPNRDARSKELLSRHKSAPIPKEDANIPLVTPSLLQMVRLRAVTMTEDQGKAPSEDKSTNQGQETCSVSIPGPQNTPQKPIRKSLSLKSPPQAVKTSPVGPNTPSMRLQEAIRMKTAAMSSRDGLPSRLGVRPSAYSSVPEGCDVHKSPASTASFIFSRSTKRVVFETAAAASSPDTQQSLKQSLAAELAQAADQSNCGAFSNGGVKSDKVPPPVAKKPAGGTSQNLTACSAKTDFGVGGNGAGGGVQRTGGNPLPETTTTRVTEDTIETLF